MKTTPVLLLLTVFLFCSSQATQAGVLMQGFYWDAPSDEKSPWWDELAKRSPELAASGFTAVWIPPVQKGASGGVSNGYDPYDDYDIGSKDQRGTIRTRWGLRDELTRSIAVMRSNGLEVYADMVLAHRNGDNGDKNFVYKNAFGHTSGGRFQKGPADFHEDNSGFGRNINHLKPDVKENLKQAGDWLMRSLDVQGVRIDVASRVPPEFLAEYLSFNALKGKFTVSEYWNENVDVLLDHIGRTGGRVSAFDFPLWGRLKDMSNGKGFYDMRKLVKAGLAGAAPQHAVTFVENHDTDRGFPTTGNKHLGYAYILTSEGYPSVFWKDYYQYGLKPVIDRLIWIHENLATGATEQRWADDDLLVYERRGGRGLLVGINDNAVAPRKEHVHTAFGSGVKLQDYSGNQPDLETDAEGKVWLTVGANSFVAYAPAGLQGGFQNESYDVNQEFIGAADLDIPPATMAGLQKVGRVYVAAGGEVKWELYFTADGWTQKSRLQLQIQDPNGQVVVDKALGAQQHPGKGSVKAAKQGWYTLHVGAQGLPKQDAQVPFWLKTTYRGPKTL